MKDYRKQERGQALVLVAFSIITLIAFVGLGVDLGLAYVERVRVQRAADAAALAAAAELPLEAAAQLRALEYLAENDYDCTLEVAGGGANCTNPEVYVNINGDENFQYDPDNPVPTSIEINTEEFAQEQGNNVVPNSAVRIRVKVTQQVPLYFMRLLGFPRVPVSGVATAENIKNLDVVLVFDQSGSMEFDTLCYGCWTPIVGEEYPNGNRYPLRWDGPPTGQPAHCQGNTAPTIKISKIDYRYMAIEAEEYSALSNDYHRATSAGQGYTAWAMQRNGSISDPQAGYLGDSSAWGRDTQGAYLMHIPYVNYTSSEGSSGVSCTWDDLNNGQMCQRSTWITNRGGPYPAPRVDYDFTVPADAGTTWYIWARVSGGDGSNDANKGYGLYWGLNEGPRGLADKPSSTSSWHYNGASSWVWRRLGAGNPASSYATNLIPGSYTLNLWAGSAGYAVDRIVITNYSGDISSTDMANKTKATLDNNRTDWACDSCDARFGGHPAGLGNTSPDGDDPPQCDTSVIPDMNPSFYYRYNDDLFDDEQPLASTAASAVRFIRKLDPAFDQIGLVRYSNKAEPARELLCLKSQGAGCTKNVMDNTMLGELMSRQKTYASGSTNLPDGLEEGIKMLDIDPPHNGRPGAAHIIILMTDGQPNKYDSLDNANQNCYAEDLWPGTDKALDCSIYMARNALNKGIVIYGITLGEGADQAIMEEISNMTGGVHLHAESPDRLDDIFDELYSRIFLRLVE